MDAPYSNQARIEEMMDEYMDLAVYKLYLEKLGSL